MIAKSTRPGQSRMFLTGTPLRTQFVLFHLTGEHGRIPGTGRHLTLVLDKASGDQYLEWTNDPSPREVKRGAVR